MSDKNTTHLAGEFLVAGELSRRGYPVSITMGNAKSVDIYAESKNGVIKIDAKAGSTKAAWSIKEVSIEKDVYYIFVYLRNQKEINQNIPPEYFVVSGKEIIKKNLVKSWRSRPGITYATLNTKDYKERWDKLPSP